MSFGLINDLLHECLGDEKIGYPMYIILPSGDIIFLGGNSSYPPRPHGILLKCIPQTAFFAKSKKIIVTKYMYIKTTM